MKQFFLSLPDNIASCFRGANLRWHMLAIVLTIILITSGFDWFYFESTRNSIVQAIFFPAIIIGALLPIILPLTLLGTGIARKSALTQRIAWTVAQAEVIGLLIAALYKALTGRVAPPHSFMPELIDTSRTFLGLIRGGIFWGWPSSHTTIAFAMAVTLFILFKKYRWVGIMAILYAFYIGLGVSVSIHWFSDFVAGAIIGSVIGGVVGRGASRSLEIFSVYPSSKQKPQ